MLLIISERSEAGSRFRFMHSALQLSSWYRLSVGTCKKEETPEMLSILKEALKKLQ
jgi:aspartate aminotransferase